MVRFLKLVKNEYLKIFLKLSTWIMIALIVVTALGLNTISKFAENKMESNSRSSSFEDMNYEGQINDLKDRKPDGYELEIEKIQFIVDHKIEPNDWKSQAVDELFHQKSLLSPDGMNAENETGIEESMQKLTDSIVKDDWKAYCNAIIFAVDQNKSLSQQAKDGQKWEAEYRLANDIPFDHNDWKSQLVTATKSARLTVSELEQQAESGQEINYAALTSAQNLVLINEYRLEHNIETETSSSQNIFDTRTIDFWSVFGTSAQLLQIISLMIIVIAGGCVATEFSSGTIKFLLINPVKRGKILMSKYAAVISISFVMLALFYLVNAIVTTLFFGVGDITAPYLYVVDGTVKSMSSFLHIAWLYLLGSVDIIVMATLAFAISSLIRSSSLAIGVGVFSMLAGSTITMVLKDILHLDWSRYIIFANTNINDIISGSSSYAHQSVGFAFAVIAVYMVVFLLTAWDGFTRREV